MTQAPAPTALSDLPALLRRGVALFARQVRALPDGSWDAPTPCAGWDVRALVGHVVAMLEAGVAVVEGAPVPRPGDPRDAVAVDASPADVAARVESLGRSLDVAVAGADLAQTRDTPAGPRSLADGLAFPVADLAVHACDVAAAAGHPLGLPDDLLAYTQAFVGSLPDDVLRRPDVFGPAVPAPADASPTTTLLAHLGRRPRTQHAQGADAAGGGGTWARLHEPATDGASGWVADQLRAIDAAGTTAAVDVQGLPVVVLTMLGRRSGTPRRVPLMRIEHDGVYAAVASKGGAATHPAWYHNLVATPELLLQDGASTTRRRARLATDVERAAWWPRCVEAFPPYADYEVAAGERVIPVFLLEPVDAPH